MLGPLAEDIRCGCAALGLAPDAATAERLAAVATIDDIRKWHVRAPNLLTQIAIPRG